MIRHQLGQAGFPPSGVSTTPHFERTRFYATNGGLHDSGNVYKIDRELLTVNGVYEFIISEYATDPSVPEDDEVILVASDYRELPAGIVVEVISVQVSASGHRYKSRQCSARLLPFLNLRLVEGLGNGACSGAMAASTLGHATAAPPPALHQAQDRVLAGPIDGDVCR